MSSNPHRVYLVGAGPGDPDLLTVKALRLIQQADVLVYDRLVSAEVMKKVPAGVTRVYVGKAPGNHHMDQRDINRLILALARKHHRVVRLKGGDPFIFGRGSEEADYLVRHGIEFEYVPGITAAAACSGYAGIPLTHRGVASSVRLITGHCRADHPLQLNWQSLADPDTTLVFYMGLANLQQLQNELIRAGLPGSTPAAAVENGTTPQQRRCLSSLVNISADVTDMGIASPALIIIGRVVDFAEQLDWFVTEMSDDEDMHSQAVQ